MDDDVSKSFRRMSSPTRQVAPRMSAALASSDNRTQDIYKRSTQKQKCLRMLGKPQKIFYLACQNTHSTKQANLESLPPYVPSYLKASLGHPRSTRRWHFCTVCGVASNYTCVTCGMRFCAVHC